MVFASTVRFTTNTASGPFVWGFVGWVVKWIIVSLTWVSPFWGVACLVVLVVLARGLHPVSFPNLEVKPFCADGTAAGRSWESRALPTVSLSELTGECWPVCGLVFPGFLFFGGGGVDPVWGRHPHRFVLFCLWCVFGGWLLRPPPIFYAFRRQTSLS